MAELGPDQRLRLLEVLPDAAPIFFAILVAGLGQEVASRVDRRIGVAIGIRSRVAVERMSVRSDFDEPALLTTPDLLPGHERRQVGRWMVDERTDDGECGLDALGAQDGERLV